MPELSPVGPLAHGTARRPLTREVRPRLKRHARPLLRGCGALQLGTTPGTGVVLEGLTSDEVAAVAALDGSLDLTGLYAAAARRGVPPARMASLIGLLRKHDLLLEQTVDRPTLTHVEASTRQVMEHDAGDLAAAYAGSGDGYATLLARRNQHVLVAGSGGVPASVATILRAGFVGQVTVGDLAADSVDAALRRGGQTETPPDLVVLTAGHAVSPGLDEGWRRRGIPVLPVVVHEHRSVVGPLVQRDGPCLRCLDLHRSDRDPAWPAILGQLASHSATTWRPAIDAVSAMTAACAGLTAMVVHAQLDGQPPPAGLSLEVTMPWPRVDYRRWVVHPRCSCRASPGFGDGVPP